MNVTSPSSAGVPGNLEPTHAPSSRQADQATASNGRSAVAETTASPMRHRPAPFDSVHPQIQRQLGMDTIMSGGGITDLPPVTVTAEEVGGGFSQDYSAFLEAHTPPPPDLNQEETLEPGDEPELLDAGAILQANEDFNALPEKLQEMILTSPTATEQMARFFAAGGVIELAEGIGSYQGRYEPGVEPTIVLDKATVHAAMDGDNDTYENGVLISAVAHELGHWVIDSAGTQQFDGGSLSEYSRFRAEGEALAIINSMIVAGEVEYLSDFNITLTGYATDAVLAPLYSAFQQDHDLDTLVGALADIVSENDRFIEKVTDYWNEWYGGGG